MHLEEIIFITQNQTKAKSCPVLANANQKPEVQVKNCPMGQVKNGQKIDKCPFMSQKVQTKKEIKPTQQNVCNQSQEVTKNVVPGLDFIML